MFPNPTPDHCNISFFFHDDEPRTLIVRDILGRELSSQQLPGSSGETTVDLSRYHSGVYLIECRKENGRKVVKKVVKQ
ncbi:T9SS type A sorting domain-containing protein [Bacteroidales bacterium OttesenSCG-928-B11]|nr:T9SS type A sorting domain-containing protein [Bacteroidales bacterium OttesenSCG-928-C03]MDL2312796.1 T9SS type A sorting domain-containing protein [Bacteroidales bacterium OttesenSCG-928-B11]MDL2325880.1 T9SS type A sorting domain-containing protein [Bacteroidales bacterium OttesenSCG-928-A14]